MYSCCCFLIGRDYRFVLINSISPVHQASKVAVRVGATMGL